MDSLHALTKYLESVNILCADLIKIALNMKGRIGEIHQLFMGKHIFKILRVKSILFLIQEFVNI